MDKGSGVEIIECDICYQGFFTLERYRLRHRLFGGGWSPELVRELFRRTDAAAVLLYDPDRDQVVLIEQFRMGALNAPGGAWLLEIVAGCMEPGESPEAVARREVMEEAGCEVDELIPVYRYLLSPAAMPEVTTLFCGRVDASRAGGIHGNTQEGEDIRVCALPVDDALARLADGTVNSGNPIIALQWLALNRDALRQRWCADPP